MHVVLPDNVCQRCGESKENPALLNIDFIDVIFDMKFSAERVYTKTINITTNETKRERNNNYILNINIENYLATYGFQV